MRGALYCITTWPCPGDRCCARLRRTLKNPISPQDHAPRPLPARHPPKHRHHPAHCRLLRHRCRLDRTGWLCSDRQELPPRRDGLSRIGRPDAAQRLGSVSRRAARTPHPPNDARDYSLFRLPVCSRRHSSPGPRKRRRARGAARRRRRACRDPGPGGPTLPQRCGSRHRSSSEKPCGRRGQYPHT